MRTLEISGLSVSERYAEAYHQNNAKRQCRTLVLAMHSKGQWHSSLVVVHCCSSIASSGMPRYSYTSGGSCRTAKSSTSSATEKWNNSGSVAGHDRSPRLSVAFANAVTNRDGGVSDLRLISCALAKREPCCVYAFADYQARTFILTVSGMQRAMTHCLSLIWTLLDGSEHS
eukprot:scpid64378/ scgid20314/ 